MNRPYLTRVFVMTLAREPVNSCMSVGRARLELATNALKGRCSTIELPTRVYSNLYSKVA